MRARRRVLARLGAFASALLARPVDSAQPASPLAMGLIPYLSTRTLISMFDPLRKHLERELGMPVMSFTATSHSAFAVGLRDGAYDFAFMPAHTMRLAMQDWGFVPLARTRAPTRIVLATRAGSRLGTADQLRGGRLVLLDRLAITSFVATDWLERQGLRPERDLEVEYRGNSSAVLLTLERTDVDAVAIIESMLQDFTAAERDRVRVAVLLQTVPSPGFAAHPRLGPDAIGRLRAALLGFGGTQTDSGSMARSPLEPIDLRDLEALDGYAARLRRLLALR